MIFPMRYRGGFTLIELLVVVAIIAILALVAIPNYSAYREKAFCSAIKSDLANLAIAQESYYYEHGIYQVVTQAADNSSNFVTFRWTPGVLLQSATGTKSSWTATAGHNNCSAGPYIWDSSAGGLQ